MKHLKVLIALLLVAFVALPASADDGRGDNLCFGGTTTVSSTERPDTLFLMGCDGRVQSGAQIGRDVVVFGGDLILEAETQVGHDVVVFGGSVQIAGNVKHQVTVFGGHVTLDSTAVIDSDVVTMGGTIDKKEGATVRGQILNETSSSIPRVRVGPFMPNVTPLPVSGQGFWNGVLSDFLRGLVTMLGLIALGALISVFMPNQLKQVSDVAQRSALPSMGVGCLTWLIVPPLMILFVLTCLGIPISAVLGILLVAAAAFGWIGLSVVLGERVLTALKAKSIVPLLAMVVGLVILWLVTAVPVLGGLIGLFVGSLALGAVVLTRFGTRPYPPLATVAPVAASVPVAALPQNTSVTPSEPAATSTDDPSASI